MKYMIHACEERKWYVDKYLYPSLIKQGISEDEIVVWMDAEHKGNLFSCMDSFLECGKTLDATWHLQDDVLISSDFHKVTKSFSKRQIVCGFCGVEIGPKPELNGEVYPYQMWWSFQCTQIPNDIAKECAEWFYNYYMHLDRDEIRNRVEGKKSDDWFFRRFMMYHHPYEKVINLKPNLVEHVDYLLGGSVINKTRKRDHTAAFFRERYLIEQLEEELKNVSRE